MLKSKKNLGKLPMLIEIDDIEVYVAYKYEKLPAKIKEAGKETVRYKTVLTESWFVSNQNMYPVATDATQIAKNADRIIELLNENLKPKIMSNKEKQKRLNLVKEAIETWLDENLIEPEPPKVEVQKKPEPEPKEPEEPAVTKKLKRFLQEDLDELNKDELLRVAITLSLEDDSIEVSHSDTTKDIRNAIKESELYNQLLENLEDPDSEDDEPVEPESNDEIPDVYK